MAHPNPIRRLLDAGLQLTELTQSGAERIVSELVKAGEVRRKDGEKMVRELLEQQLAAAERFRATVRDEVARQMGAMAGRLDQVEALLGQLVSRLTPGATTVPPADAAPPEVAPAKNAATTKKAAAKKRAPAKRAPARTTTKQAATKRAPTKAAAATVEPVATVVAPLTAASPADTAD